MMDLYIAFALACVGFYVWGLAKGRREGYVKGRSDTFREVEGYLEDVKELREKP